MRKIMREMSFYYCCCFVPQLTVAFLLAVNVVNDVLRVRNMWFTSFADF